MPTHFTPEQFDYTLPNSSIAQTPANPRESAKLLTLNRSTGEIQHHHISDLPQLLGPNDVLVRNNSKVIPARIFGQKMPSGGRVEVLLVRPVHQTATAQQWECLVKPGLKPTQQLAFPTADHPLLTATCREVHQFTRTLEFHCSPNDFWQKLDQVGQTPTPPYIHWDKDNEDYIRQAYQTYYAKLKGSVAAPTAGLHFTPALDAQLTAKGVQIIEITLHVGLGTFLPLQPEQLSNHELHPELCEITVEAAAALNAAKAEGKRIIATGTTTTRALESAAELSQDGQLKPFSGDTKLFIQPGFQFRFVDSMITNFHFPQSSLLMLVSALCSTPNAPQAFSTFAENPVGIAYQAALENQYRFYSFGDAMWIY